MVTDILEVASASGKNSPGSGSYFAGALVALDGFFVAFAFLAMFFLPKRICPVGIGLRYT
jgi:hypothetical protein